MGKIFSNFFGMLLLMAGLGAGVVLVTQPQLFNKMASVQYLSSSCGVGYLCKNYAGSSACLGAKGEVSSCFSSTGIPGNCCVSSATPAPIPCSYTNKCKVGVCKNGFCAPFATLQPIANCTASNNMLYFSQTDPRWKDAPVQGGACDFKYIGCGPSVITSIVASRQGNCYSPYETSQKAIPNFTCNGIGAHGAADVLKNMGVSTTRVADSPDPNTMKKNIVSAYLDSGGKPIMVGVKIKEPNGTVVNHVTLVVGFNAQTGNPIFNDPLFGPNMELEAKGYQIIWETADADRID